MAFMGMRGNGDWVGDQRPKSWREKVLQLYPNGDAPLTGILSKMRNESVSDPEFYWWTKSLAKQAATVTGKYTDAAMGVAYANGGVAGQAIYLKCSAAQASEFRAGHQVLLQNTADFMDNTNAKVTKVTLDGANSQIAVTLLQNDPAAGTDGIARCNRVLIIGSVNPEGGIMPDAIAYDPVKHYNYTQIFRTSLSITRTARLTRLRTGDQYKEAKREAMELHSIEMEKAFLLGVRTEGIGANGKPERTTGGLGPAILANSGNTSNFATDTDFNNSTWLENGEEWLDKWTERIFRYGGTERMAFVGSGTILAINKLVKEYGSYEFTPRTVDYGISVKSWVTAFGTIHCKIHPLFSYDPSFRNTMLVFDPKDLAYMYVTDTTFYGEGEKQNTGRGRIDGTDEEFLTEAGLEFHHYEKMGFLWGFGADNGTP